MKWEFVFNSELNGKYWDDYNKLLNIIKETGYKFYTWSGDVYDIHGNKTGLKVSDLI